MCSCLSCYPLLNVGLKEQWLFVMVHSSVRTFYTLLTNRASNTDLVAEPDWSDHFLRRTSYYLYSRLITCIRCMQGTVYWYLRSMSSTLQRASPTKYTPRGSTDQHFLRSANPSAAGFRSSNSPPPACSALRLIWRYITP